MDFFVANVLLIIMILSYEKHPTVGEVLLFQRLKRPSDHLLSNRIRLRGGSTDAPPYSANYIAPNYTSVPLVAWRELTTPSSESTDIPRRRVIEVEVDCSQTGWTLEPGDCLGVRCANSPDDVRELLSLLGVDATPPGSEGRPEHEVATARRAIPAARMREGLAAPLKHRIRSARPPASRG